MRSKITVLGDEREGELFPLLAEGDWVDLGGEDGLSGSDVVVFGDGDVTAGARRAAEHASGAVLLVVTRDVIGGVSDALVASLLPRGRVIGVRPDQVRTAAEAVVLGRETALEAAVLCRGELGIDDEVRVVPVVVGSGGVRRIGP
jgi:hypothetical protein